MDVERDAIPGSEYRRHITDALKGVQTEVASNRGELHSVRAEITALRQELADRDAAQDLRWAERTTFYDRELAAVKAIQSVRGAVPSIAAGGAGGAGILALVYGVMELIKKITTQ